MKTIVILFLIFVLPGYGANWDQTRFKALAKHGPLCTLFEQEFFEDTIQVANHNHSEAKAEVVALLKTLSSESFEVRTGADREIRHIFVGAQGDIERTLASYLRNGKITHLVGIIHTPAPATPLCSQGEISTELVHPSLQGDYKRLYTVMKRPQIIRELLSQGGVLIAAYPKNGLNKRTGEQQAIFANVKKQYPQNLVDLPLSCDEMKSEMIGATYLFKTKSGDWMAFAILASQANAPEDGRTWGMWFGSLSKPAVQKRVQKVFDYLHTVQDQDLSSYVFGNS